jgi:hypothetical protein
VNEQDLIQPTTVPVEDKKPPRLTPYELLMRQSRKMGGVATRTVDLTKDFLKRDVNTIRPPRPEAILFGKKAEASSDSVSAKEAKAIQKVVKRSHEVLAGARTIPLPINLFPDSIIVDRTKVTITRRTFFWTSQVITTRIEDILAVTSNLGPIFGSLLISTRVMNSTDHYDVNYFWRKDAEYIKQIIQGYVIAQHNSIETKHLSREELVDTLLELGRDSSI